MFFPVVGVYEHLHVRLGDFSMHLQFNVNAVRQLMGKTFPSLKRLPTFWAHLVLESSAAVAELRLRQREALMRLVVVLSPGDASSRMALNMSKLDCIDSLAV